MNNQKEANIEDLELKPSKKNLYIATGLLILLIASFFIRTTTLIQNKFINLLTQFMVSNVLNIILICGSLFTMYAVEMRKFYGNTIESPADLDPQDDENE